ncbi:hypothetical protein R4144_10145 [Gordonia amicalis]|uniref:hypothetical protein n=1 Tax=Gordonia amicalis TaxID=89053 RepID=UPI002952B810|nr:hypothetical protein [Gordonia amicalis]MDV7173731.1 hypothetical protein [Gordonia amicalis]
MLSPREPTYTPSGFVGPPVIDGTREAPTLSRLESELGATPAKSTGPNPATTLMLGPMVRGHEVKMS